MNKRSIGSLPRGAISLLLTLCLLLGLVSVPALATDGSVHTGTYRYLSNEAHKEGSTLTHDVEDTFTWSDDWFLTDGRCLNPRLATLSAIAAITTAGYSPQEPTALDAAFFAQRDRNVKAFLEEMDFEDYAVNGYYHLNRLQDSAGCAVAHKTIADGDSEWTLLAVFPTSAGYYDEWAGNFHVGETGLHEGFKAGCDEILRFVKQYMEEQGITGEVKIWTAGHSRGSALANLLGAFFAAGGGGYFGENVYLLPENVYCYTYATPGTVAPGVTLGQLLSVAGARGGEYAGKDTPGSAWAYDGEDGTEDLYARVHEGVFEAIHNCRLNYDLITLLPPEGGWDFTVFGTEFYPELSQGPNGALKARMLEHLAESDPGVSAAYARETELRSTLEASGYTFADIVILMGATGDEAVCNWVKLDLDHAQVLVGSTENNYSQLSFVLLGQDGAYSTAQMMADRIDGLRAIMPDRAVYLDRYQETFSAAMGIYGMAWETARDKIAEMLGDSAAEALALNYLAYVSERLREEGSQDPDTDAVCAVLLGLARYLTGEPEASLSTLTVDGFVEKLAKKLTPLLDLKILLEDGSEGASIGEFADNLLGIAEIYGNLYGDESLADVTRFVGAVKEITGRESGDFPISSMLKDCTEAEGREKLYRVIQRMLPEGKENAIYAINADVTSPTLEGSAPLREAVERLLGQNLVLEGQPTTLEAAARASLVKAVDQLREKALAAYGDPAAAEQLNAHFATIMAHPKEARDIAMNLLCRTDSVSYSFADELRSMLTFLAQAEKVAFAHYNELYIAWMRAEEDMLPAAGPYTVLTDETGPRLSVSEDHDPPLVGDKVTVSCAATGTEYLWFRRMPTEGGESLSRILGQTGAEYTVTAEDAGWQLMAVALQKADADGIALAYTRQVRSAPTAAVPKNPGPDAVPVSPEDFTYLLSHAIAFTGREGQEYLVVPRGTVPTEADWSGHFSKPCGESGDVSFSYTASGDELAAATAYDLYTRAAESVSTLPGPAVKTELTTSLESIMLGSDGYLNGLVGETETVETIPEEGLSLQWYRFDGPMAEDAGMLAALPGREAIPGATACSYRLTEEDEGKYIGVQAEKDGTLVGTLWLSQPVGCGTVTFDSMGGTVLSAITGLRFGDKLTRPADPTRGGALFAGWYQDEEYEFPWSFVTDTVMFRELTLYARWTAVPVDTNGTTGTSDSASEKATVPLTGESTSANVTVEVEDNTARLREADAETVLEAENVGTVTIDLRGLEEDIQEVVIPTALVTKAAEADSAEGLNLALTAGTVKLDAAALEQAAAEGKDVSVAVKTGEDGSTAVEVTVDGVPLDTKVKVELPQTGEGQVLVLVLPDGTEEVVKKSLVEDGVVYAEVPAGAVVKVAEKEKTFPDVEEDAWYADAVDFASSHALFQGTDQGFEPDAPMDRAMLVTVLYRLEDAAAEGTSPFADVAEDAWYAEAVTWASDAGLVQGTDRGFEPDAPVTREQIAVILFNYGTLLGLDMEGRASLDAFADGGDTADWAKEAMSWAVSAGLFQGDDGALEPGAGATRAQVAVLLQRLVGLLVK